MSKNRIKPTREANSNMIQLGQEIAVLLEGLHDKKAQEIAVLLEGLHGKKAQEIAVLLEGPARQKGILPPS